MKSECKVTSQDLKAPSQDLKAPSEQLDIDAIRKSLEESLRKSLWDKYPSSPSELMSGAFAKQVKEVINDFIINTIYIKDIEYSFDIDASKGMVEIPLTFNFTTEFKDTNKNDIVPNRIVNNGCVVSQSSFDSVSRQESKEVSGKQRTMTHLTAGDYVWTPMSKELGTLVQHFQTAEHDPLSAKDGHNTQISLTDGTVTFNSAPASDTRVTIGKYTSLGLEPLTVTMADSVDLSWADEINWRLLNITSQTAVDPGHTHNVHGVTDPGHSHSINDATHNHSLKVHHEIPRIADTGLGRGNTQLIHAIDEFNYFSLVNDTTNSPLKNYSLSAKL